MSGESVLILDPDRAMAELSALVLGEEGYKTRITESREEAIRLLSSSHFDLIISEAFDQDDVFTFDPTFLQDLRSMSDGIPILLCSIYPSVASVRAGQFGLAEVVPKPYDIDSFLAKVRKALDRTGLNHGMHGKHRNY
ncbi:MAG: hypothetical protein HY675_16495 [Chloroflexi bacterium]|nr:hypothetical protein [Chloroflexota bacterium]